LPICGKEDQPDPIEQLLSVYGDAWVWIAFPQNVGLISRICSASFAPMLAHFVFRVNRRIMESYDSD
jgi:hypothetical protein